MKPQPSPQDRPPPPAAAGPRQAPPRAGTPEVETFQIVRWINGQPTGHQPIPELLDATETAFAPTIRPPVPILTVLDDGSIDGGEQIRIRKKSFVIGRSSGDLIIPIDATLPGRHAEIGRAHV